MGLACGTEAHAVMHLPAEVCGEGETTVGVGERQKEDRVQGYSERKRLWERV